MGRSVCAALSAEADLDLVAAVDPQVAGTTLEALVPEAPGAAGLTVSDSIDELSTAGAEVAVDFTVASSAMANMRWCAANGVHGVVGTSGLGPDELSELARAFGSSSGNCVVAPNFAIGAVLLMRLAALAAPHMEAVEIVELHHDAKRDAPSGTAMRTAELLDEARRHAAAPSWPADPTTQFNLAGTRGGSGPGGIRIHSVRLPGLLAHQEVVFGAKGQSLTLRHDSYDRSSFMPGVLLAVRQVGRHRGLTVGLEALLGV